MNAGAATTELGDRGYSRFSAARRLVWLNTAKNRFEDYPFDWPWLKATATGAAPLSVSDVRRVLSVVDSTNTRPLEPMDPNMIVDFEDDSLATTGTPQWWYLSADTVTVYPVQAASLSVRYVKFSPELSADSDTPLIPARYHQTWVDLAEVEALRYGVKDVAAAASLEVSVKGRLEEIATVYAMQSAPADDESLVTGASVDG